jgi:hypothetical protein
VFAAQLVHHGEDRVDDDLRCLEGYPVAAVGYQQVASAP